MKAFYSIIRCLSEAMHVVKFLSHFDNNKSLKSISIFTPFSIP